MQQVIRYSYWFITLTLFLVGYLKLATPLLAVLFSYLILSILNIKVRKWIAVLTFIVIVALVFYGFGFFINQALEAMPQIISRSFPAIIQYAHENNIDLPATDIESLKALMLEGVQHQLGYLANFAKLATKEFVFMLIGLVVGISLFLNSQLDLDQGKHRVSNNLYSLFCRELSKRFGLFYESFETVMGAQLIIALINTFFTACFVALVKLDYAFIVIVITFLCGLLPIIGNIISNAVIVGIGLMSSLNLALSALTFLIVLHKLEYFLNSKIIGVRIKNPMWLTLLSLIIGERLMGIPGMILAPVVLYYIKTEAKEIAVVED